MHPTVIPVVQTWGTKQHLRYAVTDTTGRFWTGSGWATHQRDALLYSGHHDAAADARRILWKQFQRHTVYQQFVVPLELEVFAQAVVGPDELKAFAKKLVKLSALYADHGTGPTPDSLILPRLNWGRMTQPVNSERDFDFGE
jgi:hypothetical protein